MASSSLVVVLSACVLLWLKFEGVRGQRGGHAHLCEESSCYPATGDLLIGRENRLTTTSTCGLTRPERYCIVSHLEDQMNKCFVCDSRRPYSDSYRISHRIENIVSTFRRDWKHHWWQAENGVQGVTIQLDLEAEFHFTHLIMRFKTFRPAAMFIERSYDFGKTWKIYRYFAYDCAESFPGIPTASSIPIRRIQDVVCESRYSDVAPSTEGEVIFRVLPPSVEIEDPYSEEVQDLLKMTNLRVNFTNLHTLGDNQLDNRPEIKEKYYYSMYHMVVRGSCSCYGHASHCVPTDEQVGNPDMVYGQCNCTHNTMGLNCERCAEFYNDLPWAPARRGQTNACKECQCNGHASRCHFDPAVYEATGRVSGGVCDDCQHNTMGHHCEECKPFYYQDPDRDISDPNVCLECRCDPLGSEHGGECESRTDVLHELVAGRCVCKRFVEGQRCDTCMDNFWNMRADNAEGCEPCNCYEMGTVGNSGCDKDSGDCRCKRYVIGRKCDECMPGYWGMSDDLQGCKPCDCDAGGAVDNQCNQQTGQCTCRANVIGRRCDQTEPGFFVMSLDWERYEGEFARGIGNCQVVVREVMPNKPVTWTGPGFMRVHEGSTLEFVIDDIPISGEYDILVRYEAIMPLRWDDVRMTIVRPFAVDQGGPCANSIPQDDFKSFSLNPGERSFLVTPTTCLEKGITYSLRLTFQRYRSDRLTPDATVLVDSIVLMPSLPSHPIREGHGSPDEILEEIERFRCRELYLQAGSAADLPDTCRRHIFSLSVHTYDGAQECGCDTIGSHSSVCSSIGGQCQCKPNVIGRQCDRCAPGAYGFGPAGCSVCGCSNVGSLNNNCDQTTGQCSCVANAYGRQCDRCQRGYFGYPNCRPCQCSGRADECEDDGRCVSCRDYTGGNRCERCADGYYGDPRPGSAHPCRPCMCPGGAGSGFQHGDSCRLDTRNNQVLCECRAGYTGLNCERCSENYFGNPLVPGGTCERCTCNRNIDYNIPGSCDAATGECLKCQYFTEGFNCEQCKPGYFGDATRQSCQPCLCNILGSRRNAGHCDRTTGQCLCLPHVMGTKCDQCERNYWKLASGHGCESCGCDPSGSLSSQCNEFDGQCQCRSDRGGRDCSECVDNYWGDPQATCIACDCHPEGSKTSQCNRRTGKCDCAPGVTGDKCDRCARGTTGSLPNCVPCGECFDNWNQIIDELRVETTTLVTIAGEIKYGGAPGAFDREFISMETKLEEVKRILAGSNISIGSLDDLQDKLRQIRSNLTTNDRTLDQLDATLEDTTNRVETVNNRIESIRARVETLKTMAENLKTNATTIKELDVSGAYNSIRESYQRSLDAQRTVDTSSDMVRQSQSVRRDVDTLLDRRRSEFDRHFDSNDNMLVDVSYRLDSFRGKIRELNDVVCDGNGDPCDALCGGAGCGKCGGSVSCQDGAVTVSDNAISLANRSEHILKTKREETDILLIRVSEAKDSCDMAFSDAQMAYDRAMFAKNQSESGRIELQTLIETITYFLEQHGAKPEDIEKVANEVLAMSISLTPQQIRDLAQEISETVRGLTDIDAILDATRGDLNRARELKERADNAKSDADEVFDTAKRVVVSLDRARNASDAAEVAITGTDEHMTDIENDLQMIEIDASYAQDKFGTSANRIKDLRARITALKVKFTENEVKVQQATEAADSASDLANEAHKNANELDKKYSIVSEQLEVKYNETLLAKTRADQLKIRATDMYTSTQTKVNRLREWDRQFVQKEQDLTIMSTETNQLISTMTQLVIDIQGVVRYLRNCGTA